MCLLSSISVKTKIHYISQRVSPHKLAISNYYSRVAWRSRLGVWLVIGGCLSVVGSNLIKGSRYFLEKKTLLSLLSTGWFQEWIRAWFHNQTKINWSYHERFTWQISPRVKYRQNQTKINARQMCMIILLRSIKILNCIL